MATLSVGNLLLSVGPASVVEPFPAAPGEDDFAALGPDAPDAVPPLA